MEMDPMKPTHAGCVVFRTAGDETSYLIVSSSTNQHWILPQGHIENGKGESADQAALRELKEEAGILGDIIVPLSLQTFIKKGETAILQNFIIRMTGETEPLEKRTVRWEKEETALAILSFEEAKQALREAIAVLKGMS